MESRHVSHPSADVLQAFGLGKLDDASAEVVASHLDDCADCRQAVAAQSGDSFIARLRQAHGQHSTCPPGQSLSETGHSGHAARSSPQATPSPNPTPLPELANHSQYEIVRELGRGGMGVVYLAYNHLLARQEVLKVVNKELIERGGGKARFLREMQSAAALSHPNVVKAHTALQLGELLVFAMEYVEGQDLDKVVKDRLEKGRGLLPVPNACYYVQQAALGLQHAFEKNMVHRDIKPQNLILAREGKKHVVKILDFGLAKVMREKGGDGGLTGTGEMLGTPAYIAPEQMRDAAHADIRADIYSLGCTLYHLLTGAPPFKGTSVYEVLRHHELTDARSVHLVRPEVPEELAVVVQKMMAKKPAERYQTPVEVAKALTPFIKPTPKAEAAKPLPNEPQKAPEAAIKDESSAGRREPSAPDFAIPRRLVTRDWRKQAALLKKLLAAPKTATKVNWKIIASVATCLLLIGLVGLLAAGIFNVKTKDGTIELRNLPHDADVLVDGDKVTVTWGSDGKTAQIRVKPGSRKIVATVNGIQVIGEEVTIKEGRKEVLTAAVVSPPDGAGHDKALSYRPGWVEEEWLRKVTPLPPEQQVTAVNFKLRQRNPGYEGSVQSRIENGAITEIGRHGGSGPVAAARLFQPSYSSSRLLMPEPLGKPPGGPVAADALTASFPAISLSHVAGRRAAPVDQDAGDDQ
jgi:serine/threonine protein kinase